MYWAVYSSEPSSKPETRKQAHKHFKQALHLMGTKSGGQIVYVHG